MRSYIDELRELSLSHNLIDLTEFDPLLLLPEDNIRKYCYENICGNYGNHWMCPPLIGSIGDIKVKLASYNKAILIRYMEEIDVKLDKKQIKRSKINFHKKILEIENFFNQKGIDAWGLVGGSCSFCIECKAITNRPCKHPHKARPSLESLGINVQKLLENFGLDNKFYSDKIIWTGCILIKEK